LTLSISFLLTASLLFFFYYTLSLILFEKHGIRPLRYRSDLFSSQPKSIKKEKEKEGREKLKNIFTE